MLVKNVHQRDCVLGERGCENDHLKVLAHLCYELAAVGAHVDENVVDPTFNIDGQHDVG